MWLWAYYWHSSSLRSLNALPSSTLTSILVRKVRVEQGTLRYRQNDESKCVHISKDYENYFNATVLEKVNTERRGPEVYPVEEEFYPVLYRLLTARRNWGFCISQADWFMYYAVYIKLARLARAIVVSVYLWLAPENRLPSEINDGFSALLWLASLARREAYEPMHMEDKFLSLAFPIGSTKDHPITCPMGPAAPPLSGLHLPPILYYVAENDLFIDKNMEFYEALKKAGKDVQLFVSHNMTHSFYLNKLALDNDPDTKSQIEKLFEGIGEFIRRH
ncbi:hypothetical protein Cgig2_001694 [Carnegiea gigantea]|uniref:Alpha/beta hydrolase fold-3 domain-containing protein n=1 Tax=Carnegiea gigantea TaxID=171969 RepID=A0A9Q1GQJ6_9CARY|nr:hypothetical protein Cgig2_001694 [Carnegiea gigantea]